MHPDLIETNLISIHTIWVFVSIAIVSGTYILIKLAVKNNLKLQFLSENSTKLLLWALLGARLLNIILNYRTYFYEFSIQSLLSIFYIWDMGLNFWGGLISFLIVFHIKCKKEEQNFWKWLDIIIPSIIFILSISHIGAFFEGTNYGRETSLPWGVNFESPSIKYTVPIHPTQIYAFLYSMLTLGVLLALPHWKKFHEKNKPGTIGLLGISIYSFLFFLEQFVRGDDTLTIFEIRVPQIISLIIFIITGIFIYLSYNRPNLMKKL